MIQRVRAALPILLVSSVAAATPIKVGYDADHLDLDKRVLQFKPSRAITEATVTVTGDDGKDLGSGSATFGEDSGGKWDSISWTQSGDARVMMIKLRVVAADGAATNVQLIPWSVSVDHEDVNFATDSSVIEDSEAAKLDASLGKIDEIVKRSGKFVKMQLYVAGHTDTVGPATKNQKLSLARATAIGAYFKKHGLSIPVAVAGYGESVLKVQTPDETDNRANRRADYVLGPAGGTPPFRGPYQKVTASWRALK